MIHKRTLSVGLLLLVGIGAVLVLTVPRMVRRAFYPLAPPMPPVVSTPVAQILADLEAALKSKAPRVLAELQPGLSNEEIAVLETKAGLHLPEEIRALYRWRNGSRSRDPHFDGPIPGHRFVPLAEALSLPTVISNQVAHAPVVGRAAFKIVAGHTKSWITLFDDGCGDGYFFDPKRKLQEGAVFYRFAEDMTYVFFPSVKNLLAGVVKSYERDAFTWKESPSGPSLNEDFNKTKQVWAEFGSSNIR